jgi:hypothetical protein
MIRLAAAILVALRLAAGGAGLTVDTDTPEAMCPDLAETRTAVAARVGEIEGAGNWHARYTIVHRPAHLTGDAVRLELEDSTGTVRLERLLPVTGRSCAAMAEAVAVVLEAYFHDTVERAATAAAEPTVAEPTPPPSPPPVTEIAPPSATAPPDRALAGELELMAGATGEGTIAGGVAVGIGGPTWRVGLVVSASPEVHSEQVAASGGSATSRTLEIRLPVILRARRARWSWGAGPELVLALERATTTSPLDPAPSWRAAPGAGAAGTLSYALTTTVAATIAVDVDATPAAWTRRFEVGDAEVLSPRTFRGFASAGLSFLWGG